MSICIGINCFLHNGQIGHAGLFSRLFDPATVQPAEPPGTTGEMTCAFQFAATRADPNDPQLSRFHNPAFSLLLFLPTRKLYQLIAAYSITIYSAYRKRNKHLDYIRRSSL
jgi:hypothetical protein